MVYKHEAIALKEVAHWLRALDSFAEEDQRLVFSMSVRQLQFKLQGPLPSSVLTGTCIYTCMCAHTTTQLKNKLLTKHHK